MSVSLKTVKPFISYIWTVSPIIDTHSSPISAQEFTIVIESRLMPHYDTKC